MTGRRARSTAIAFAVLACVPIARSAAIQGWSVGRAEALRYTNRAEALRYTATATMSAQVRYAAGQNVVPVFEGWERNADGSFTMVFGYMNRNYEEEMDIAVGPDNMLEPGVPDQGQPSHFYSRRQQYVFKVIVPKDFGNKDLVWTLTTRGKTEKAYGSLWPIWELDAVVYDENRNGAVGEPSEQPNQPPTIEIGGAGRKTVAAGAPLTLTAKVIDDGLPKPRGRAGVAVGSRSIPPAPIGTRRENPLTQAVVRLDPGVRLGVTWVQYRGPGAVIFDPMHARVVDGTATTTATFSQPGAYVLRAYADDGVLLTTFDVPVTVTAASAR